MHLTVCGLEPNLTRTAPDAVRRAMGDGDGDNGRPMRFIVTILFHATCINDQL